MSGEGSSSGSKTAKRPPPTCLIVHGDAMVGRWLERLLERFNLETHSVTSGKEALDFVLTGKSFDMIFINQQLSDMDGKEVTKALVKAGVKGIMVGLHESSTSPEEMKAFMAAGLDCSIDKPLTDSKVKELYEKLGVKVEFVVKK